jgi:hypothetical protein
MSLFDTLRYPVVDIYDNKEMGEIPQIIIDPWFYELIDFCFKIQGTTLETRGWYPSLGTIVARAIMIKSTEALTELSNPLNPNDNNWPLADSKVLNAYLKEHFTKNLRKRIEAYESV